VGSVRDWSGLEAEGGASWLVDHAADLKFNAIWFSPLSLTTDIQKVFHGKTLAGSYYAARDHFRLDPDFSCGDAEKDREHLRHFSAEAKKKGITIYADLVFNHVAADHPLVDEENREIEAIRARAGNGLQLVRGNKNKLIGLSWQENGEKKEFFFKFRRSDDLKLQFGGPPEDPWTDAAQINYSSPEARRYFVEGDASHKGLFKQLIDWHLDNGFTAFRCDAAYMIPPESWEEIVSYAHSRCKDVVFMAETLCSVPHKVERMKEAMIVDGEGKGRPAFDLGMLGFYWWNMKDDWLPQQENKRVQDMSKYGGAGSPDTHDTDGTIAGGARKAFNRAARPDAVVAEISLRNFALSTLCANSSYTQMGYEFCNEKQNGVFRGQVSRKDWDNLVKRTGTTLDICEGMRAINELKENLHVENCRVNFTEHRPVQDGKLIRIRCEFIDVDTNQKTAEIALLVNQKPEKGPVQVTDAGLVSNLEKAGLQRLGGARADVISDVLVLHSPIPAKAPKPGVSQDNTPKPPPAMAA
jgi:starch synthase (maltosyl-transferring)